MHKIQVLKENKVNNLCWKEDNHEITIIEEKIEVEYTEQGKIEKITKNPINLTRRINETAKILKQQTAQEKLEKITKALMN